MRITTSLFQGAARQCPPRRWRRVLVPPRPGCCSLSSLSPSSNSDTLVSAAELERLQLARDVAEVRSLLSDLRKSGLGPSLVHYNVAIDHAAKRGDGKAALGFFHDLVAEQHAPTVVTFNTTMRACDAAGLWKTTLDLHDAMSDHSVEPNVISFSCAIKATERSCQWARTLELFDSMVTRGLTPSLPAYRAALSASFHNGQW